MQKTFSELEDIVRRVTEKFQFTLLIDYNGTIVDTDRPDPDSAKGQETRYILSDKAGITLPDDEFDEFYSEFSRRTQGTNPEHAASVFLEMVRQRYSALRDIDPDEFLRYRQNVRAELTYSRFASFIGDNKKWFENMPKSLREATCLVSNNYINAIGRMKDNPKLTVANGPLLEWLPKYVTLDDEGATRKPDPSMHNIALQREYKRMEGKPMAAEGICGIFIEDSMQGVEAGLKARNPDGGKLFGIKVDGPLDLGKIAPEDKGRVISSKELYAVDIPTMLAQAGYSW